VEKGTRVPGERTEVLYERRFAQPRTPCQAQNVDKHLTKIGKPSRETPAYAAPDILRRRFKRA
jgi:hypothetical protein